MTKNLIPSKALLVWYKKNKRVFYWKTKDTNNFKKFIIEILLQRTGAEKVNNFYKEFFNKINSFRDIDKLSRKKLADLLAPLGLSNQKANNLKELSKIILKKFKGKIPSTKDLLITLPGVGEYIANATICFIHKKRIAIVDVNVARILSRFYNISLKSSAFESQKQLTSSAEFNLPKKNFIDYNYALIDLGAMICKAKIPKCNECPISKKCNYKIKS